MQFFSVFSLFFTHQKNKMEKPNEEPVIDIEPSTEKVLEKEYSKAVTYVDGVKEEDDHISIESESNEFVLRQPPDGGRAWLVLFGCFCVST